MSQSSSTSVITLNFNPPALRWLLLLPAGIALVLACVAMRWYVGNTIAEYAPPADEGGLEMAQVAVRWAPDDPLTHWRLAVFEEKTFSAENLAAAVREYRFAVQAAPYDYRYWMELGRALEAGGDPDSGEKALLRAVELAPAYSHPRWYYGNLLLRQGKTDEAFVQLARAAAADEVMRPAIFGMALQAFAGDVDKVVQVLPTPVVRLQFAVSLINAGKIEEGTRILRLISAADKKAQSEITQDAVKSLLDKKQFHAALAVLRELEPDGSQLPKPEQFWNGDFEQSLPLTDSHPFRWVINMRPQAQVSIDSQGHHGNALRIIFKAPSKLEGTPVSQTIIVEPDTQYRLQFFLRTASLTSMSTPVVIVSDAVDGKSLASSPPVPTGTNDWQQVAVNFKTNPNHDGISIGVVRQACDDKEPICPIFGNLWYDDFNLQRLSGPSAPRRASSSAR